MRTRSGPAAATAGAGRRRGPVEVRLVALPARTRPEDLALLGAEEADRALGCGDPLTAARFVGGRAALRRALGERLGVDPGRLAFERDRCPGCGSASHGPPRLAAPYRAWCFSLSRSGGTAAVAVAEGIPLGLDIERTRPRNIELMARYSLSGRERARLDALPAERRLTAFHQYWSRKEAVTKAGGIGLVGDLRLLETEPGPEPDPGSGTGAATDPDGRAEVRVRQVVAGRPAVWSVQDLPLPVGLVGALATPTGADLRLTVPPARPTHG